MSTIPMDDKYSNTKSALIDCVCICVCVCELGRENDSFSSSGLFTSTAFCSKGEKC